MASPALIDSPPFTAGAQHPRRKRRAIYSFFRNFGPERADRELDALHHVVRGLHVFGTRRVAEGLGVGYELLRVLADRDGLARGDILRLGEETSGLLERPGGVVEVFP